MRMLIQLPAIGVFDTLPACPLQHGAGGAAEQVIEQGAVVVEWPQQVGHGKGDMLPVEVGQDVLLFGDPLLGGLEATTAAGFGLAGLAKKNGHGYSPVMHSCSGELPWHRCRRHACARRRVWSSR